jgi:hypothetical protein
MVKYLHISSYIRKPFLIYDFAPDPMNFHICEENLVFFNVSECYFLHVLEETLLCTASPNSIEMMKKQAEHQDNTAELKEAFKIFDRDGNGYIDAEELKKVSLFRSSHQIIDYKPWVCSTE